MDQAASVPSKQHLQIKEHTTEPQLKKLADHNSSQQPRLAWYNWTYACQKEWISLLLHCCQFYTEWNCIKQNLLHPIVSLKRGVDVLHQND